MNDGDLIAILLLMVLSLSLAVGGAIVLLGIQLNRKGLVPQPRNEDAVSNPGRARLMLPQPPPTTWLVVRGRSLGEIQSALRLHNSKPCPCAEGLRGSQAIFIAPPSGRWTLVTGSGLPEPGEDIDLCFRFIQRLSRKLGTIQYFNSNRMQNHHAWVWCERGRVIRAYAWIGHTAWNQGLETSAERDLGLRCLPYLATADRGFADDFAAANTEKVSLLAARWGADPAAILDALREPANGIAGDPARLD